MGKKDSPSVIPLTKGPSEIKLSWSPLSSPTQVHRGLLSAVHCPTLERSPRTEKSLKYESRA